MERLLPAVLTVLLLAGCVTPEVDWQARIGQYTQDQAIADLGPPEKSVKSSDGTVEDEWLLSRAHVIFAPEPYFLPPGSYSSSSTPSFSETHVPNYFLRLTFGPDGKLQAWKKFAK